MWQPGLQKTKDGHPRKLGLLERFTIRRCVRGERLPCRCLAGVYETATGRLLTIIDATGDGCDERAHGIDVVVCERKV